MTPFSPRAAAITLAVAALPIVHAASAATIAYTPGASSGIYYDMAVDGAFADRYLFSIGQTATASVSLSSTPYAALTLSDLGLFDAAGVELTSFTQGRQQAALGAGTDAVTLAPGTYAIGVTGAFRGTGSYTGVLSVSAVPLPPSAALFGVAVLSLAGMGALGRRSGARARPAERPRRPAPTSLGYRRRHAAANRIS